MMSLANEKEFVTGQGFGTPEPVGTGCGKAGTPRPSSSDCLGGRKQMSVDRTGLELCEGQDPFKRRHSIARSPPSHKGSPSISLQTKQVKADDLEVKAQKIENDEKSALEGLGKNIFIIEGILKDAKNIHKQIREASAAAAIFYQRLKEAREERLKLEENAKNGKGPFSKKTPSGGNQSTQTEKQKFPQVCACQTKKMTDAVLQTASQNNGDNTTVQNNKEKKRSATSPPEMPQERRKVKMVRRTIEKESVNTSGLPETTTKEGSPWQTVDHRKKKRRKGSEHTGAQENRGYPRNGNAPNKKSRRTPLEALAVKIAEGRTYASVLKDLRSKINPHDIGVDVSGIKKTRKGEILIEIKNGGSKTEELRLKVAEALGQEAAVRTLDRAVSLVVKDLDGATDEIEVAEAIKAVLPEDGLKDTVKVRALRTVYRDTQMAIVTMSQNAVDIVLKVGRLKIGWVMCRVSEREKLTQCYRCLGFDHIARSCKGPDRSKICRLCGKDGHFSKECKNQHFSIICSEANEPSGAHHILDSRKCEARRKQGMQAAK